MHSPSQAGQWMETRSNHRKANWIYQMLHLLCVSGLRRKYDGEENRGHVRLNAFLMHYFFHTHDTNPLWVFLFLIIRSATSLGMPTINQLIGAYSGGGGEGEGMWVALLLLQRQICLYLRVSLLASLNSLPVFVFNRIYWLVWVPSFVGVALASSSRDCLTETTKCPGSISWQRATCPYGRGLCSQIMQVICLNLASQSNCQFDTVILAISHDPASAHITKDISQPFQITVRCQCLASNQLGHAPGGRGGGGTGHLPYTTTKN